MEMIKVAALTSGKYTPSTRFRIRQHIVPLRAGGIDVREYIPAIDKNAGVPSQISDHMHARLQPGLELLWRGMKLVTRTSGIIGSWKADITWLGRELLPGRYTLESLLKRPIVFDVDDAIWQARPNGTETIAKIASRATVVLAGNRYLADWFSQYTDNIRIVPTAVDTDRYIPRLDTPCDEDAPFIVGWTGISGNFVYLYKIENALFNFLSQHKAKLLVVAETPPQFRKLTTNMVRFVQWSPSIEVRAIQEMDVGLMPLPSTPWARGKCSLKMLTYMACGLPVIVSPVGMNEEILSMDDIGFGATIEDDYYDALRTLYIDRERCRKLGEKGRRIAQIYFSRHKVCRDLTEIFKELT